MNRQGKLVNGKVAGGIEWTKTVNSDGTEQRGFTWNPVGGCFHRCRWTMPDGTTATCYAELVAENVAQAAYPLGFANHYWNPGRLGEPLRVKQPARIFLDSMSDLMGHWVPGEQIQAVLDICQQASQHTFQLLTKNAPRLAQFAYPPNIWVGVSSPPDSFMGKPLSRPQQIRMLKRSLEVLRQIEVPVKWMSVEPLSWDIAPHLVGSALNWVVVGAATNGPRQYQPEPEHVSRLLGVLDREQVPVFFKGNLEWQPWREGFPSDSGKR